MYTATGKHALGTCLTELFQESRPIYSGTGGPVFVIFEIKSAVTLLDLSGIFATRIGASAAAFSSGARSITRDWSMSLYEAYKDIDGILYGSSMYANYPAIALFEMAQGVLPTHPDLHRQLSDPAMKTDLLDISTKMGYGFL